MYDPHVLRDEWDKKYGVAAKVFIAVHFLLLLAIFGLAVAMPVLNQAGGLRNKMLGAGLLLLGATVIVGTGLIKKWRWAAVAATLWCLAIIGGNIYNAAQQSERSKPARAGNAGFESGQSLGTGCGGLMVLIMLVASARAAIAKAPREEQELEIDPDLRADFNSINPYGVAAAPQPRKVPAVAFTIMGIGAFIATGGVVLVVQGVSQAETAHHIAEDKWRTVTGPRCSVEFPGEPSVERGGVSHAETSSSYLWSSRYQKYELVHYRVPANRVFNPEGIETDLKNWRHQMNSTIVKSEQVEVSGQTAIKHHIRDDQNGRSALLLGVARGRDVYLLMALDVDSDVSYRDRFINSFKLTDR